VDFSYGTDFYFIKKIFTSKVIKGKVTSQKSKEIVSSFQLAVCKKRKKPKEKVTDYNLLPKIVLLENLFFLDLSRISL
jgi:hypothetical protein